MRNQISKDIHNKAHISSLRDIANSFGFKLKVKYENKKDCVSCVDFENDVIELSLNKKEIVSEVFSVFFHELAHLVNKYLMKYKYYHSYDPRYFTLKEWSHFFRTAKRAENYAEKVGKELMNVYFPDIKFVYGYTKSNIDDQIQDMKENIYKTYSIFKKNKG